MNKAGILVLVGLMGLMSLGCSDSSKKDKGKDGGADGGNDASVATGDTNAPGDDTSASTGDDTSDTSDTGQGTGDDTEQSTDDDTGQSSEDTGDTSDTGQGTGEDTGQSTDDDTGQSSEDTGQSSEDTGVDTEEDTGNSESCPDTVPDADLTDDESPTCAGDGMAGTECEYGGITCVCRGGFGNQDPEWTCAACPDDMPGESDECDLVDQECGYGDDTCVCERQGFNQLSWNCGGEEETDESTEPEDTTPYECPADQPDADSSCAEEADDHINCAYDDGMVCICGGAAAKAQMIWQCVQCPADLPIEDDTCGTTGLECSYTEADCVCERNGAVRNWNCGGDGAEPPSDTEEEATDTAVATDTGVATDTDADAGV